MSKIHFQKLAQMYLSANVNQQIYDTTTCEITEGQAVIGLTIEPKYFHALNAIHGSVYFKLLDDAAFFAVNSIVEDVFVLTTSFTINLLRPVQKGKIKAIGKVKHIGGRNFVAESALYNEEGVMVACGIGNFTKSKVRLTTEIGYQ